MLTIALGLATALTYGFADFFGAIGSRKLRPILVTALAAFGGLSLLLLLAQFDGFRPTFDRETITWGLVAGLCSAFALSALYAALAEGPIAILSPLSAVISAIFPAVFDLTRGATFSAASWIAILLVLIAIVLVGYVPSEDKRMPSARGLLFATIAGIGIGMVFIALDLTPKGSGLGSVIILRTVNGVILIGAAIVLLLTRRAEVAEFKVLDLKLLAIILAAGVCDASANAFFISAAQTGSLTVVSVLTALYPLGTIVLAFAILKEKVATSQLIGIGLALGACVLLAL